jgi:ankyrin repeat protein
MVSAILNAFKKHSRDELLHRDKLSQALKDCRKQLSSADIENAFQRTHAEGEGLCLDKFSDLILRRTKVEDWAATLCLERLLAFSLPSEVHESENFLDSICALRSNLDGVIKVFAKNVGRALLETIDCLENIQSMHEQAQCHVQRKIRMRSLRGGKVNDFHVSLTDSLGWPSLDFFDEMEREHKNAPETEQVCPANEFAYVRGEKAVPHKEMKEGRKIPKYSELMRTQTARESGLIEEEVIAIILYTGPMFGPYNTELRSIHSHRNRKPHQEPHYLTTIFVISSAIVKLSRAQHIPCGLVLYRGLGGNVDFPGFFHDSDSLGCKGITEPGFMSTTKRIVTGIKYSGLKKDRPFPVMLEMHVRSIDRGADISEFSQYQHEAEFHWPPGCFLELLGKRKELITYECEGAPKQGILSIFEVRVNCNLKTMTIDELLLTRKNIHLQTFSLLISDAKRGLEDPRFLVEVKKRLTKDDTKDFDSDGKHTGKPICDAKSLVGKIVSQCKEVRKKHMLTKVGEYKSVESYRKLVQTMLETVTMAKSKVRGWMEDSDRKICLDYNCALRICHRERMSFLLGTLPAEENARQKQAEKLCIEMGLVGKKAAETNDLGEPRLVEAAAAGQAERDILLLLAAKANVNSTDKDGCSPLFAAARNGHVAIVKLLLDNKGGLNATNKYGQTPLWIASKNNQTHCLELLIKCKASFSQRDKDRAAPLWVAAQYGRVKVLELLLKERADVNAVDADGCSPIFAAAYAGKEDSVEILLKHGADANLSSKSKHSPLIMAAQQGHVECLRLLLATEGIRVDQRDAGDGETAVFAAAQSGHPECVRLLIEAGADIGIKSKQGITPEQIAKKQRKRASADLLRQLAGGGKEGVQAPQGRPSKRQKK